MKFTYASGDQPLPGYTIRRGLGRGGFGEVYQAVSDGGKEVALKLVQRNLNVELRGVGQCLNLKHPNLVALYDVKQAENGDYWVVMEYMSGESLDQVIARHAQGMAPEEALGWLRGVCEGVGYLHERGIVHRDLKPGNFFIEHGIIKIGDYGLSKFISTSRRSGQTESVGTVHYIAPEVSRGRYGKEVDLYALGIILHEMLTGRVPFDGESPGEVLMKHLTAEPDLSVLPPPYRAVVARLLDKEPQRRYPSVQEMLADLDGRGRPVGAEPDAEWVGAAGARSSSCSFAKDTPRPGWPPRTSDVEDMAASSVGQSSYWAGRVGGEMPWSFNPTGILASLRLIVARLGISVFVGIGVGLLAGGFTLSRTPQNYEAAALLGPGCGFLAAALTLYKMLRSSARFAWMRGLVALFIGPGAGLFTAGMLMRKTPRNYEAAALLGPGVGFLACGLAAYLLLFGRFAQKKRRFPVSAAPHSHPPRTQPWQPSSERFSS